MNIHFLPGEKWYGPEVVNGFNYPLDETANQTICLEPCTCGNQTNPLMLSTAGRYIFCDTGFTAVIHNGSMEVTSKTGTIDFYSEGQNLRGAFLAAAKAHFPANGVLPPEEFFTSPQLNTWIELIYDQNQKDILNYARTAVAEGIKPGVIMIDDLWSNYYGKWDFDRKKFPDPKGMMDELHALGFKVIMWICPFVSLDSAEYRDLSARGCFVRDPNTEQPCYTWWWNGISAVLDFTNPTDVAWFEEQTEYLVKEYGVDGFKFDAGDAGFYGENSKTYAPVLPTGQTELWAKFGLKYPYNEYRACYGCAGLPLVQRLCDKGHSWNTGGLGAVLPNSIMQGLLGYAFGCPDMVGGGSFADFLPGAKQFDPELFVRYCGASTLLPMIQFSAAPWRVLDKEHYAAVKDLMKQREEYMPVIMKLVREATKTGEPAVRHMEYVFPGQGLANVNDQFMLGDDLLVAPCVTKGTAERQVALPEGSWKAEDGTIYMGGTTIAVPAPLGRIPVFTRIDA
ncbi:MAG: glycoside hydrolase [Clostridiales bacterium]|nr:glycoside hydrolase [Clostridiales bacterium]